MHLIQTLRLMQEKAMCPKGLFIAWGVAAIVLSGGCVGAEDSFIGRSGLKFVKNGKPFHFNGFNAYWLMMLGSSNSTKDKVSSAFAQATKFGMTVARTWAFGDGGSSAPLQKSPGVYDENMFKGLDFVVSEAKKHGIYLILSFVNNFSDLGGKKQYVEWGRQKGQSVNNEDDFFTNPTVKQFYKDHIKTVLTRKNTITGVAYKDESNIFSWELMNEPRCQNDPSGKTVQAWVQEMAGYVKSIDKWHLLEVGLEGFYGEAKKQSNPNSSLFGTDFIAINNIANVDWTTAHIYPDQWLQGSNDAAQTTFAYRWAKEHAEDSKSIVKKPYVLAEFGKSSKQSGFSVEARNKYFKDLYDIIYGCAKNGGPCGGALFWQLLADGIDNYGDGYQVVLGRDPSTDNIIGTQSRRISSIN